MTSHLSPRNIADNVQLMIRSFPATSGTADGDEYFWQCPESFERDNLCTFQHWMNSEESRTLVSSLKKFQQWTTRKWNPNVDSPTLSLYIGLFAIDEAASKERGSVTQFTKTDVVAVKANLKRRLEENVGLRECIMHELTSGPMHEHVSPFRLLLN